MEINTRIARNSALLFSLLVGILGCESQHISEKDFNCNLVGIQQFADSVIVEKMNEYQIPGLSIGIVKEGRSIYSAGYGNRDLLHNKPVSERTIFHTASISKLFTAQAILFLQNSQELHLDEKVSSILPRLNYSKEAKDITIRQLLNHTSGLPDISNYDWESALDSQEALRDYFEEITLVSTTLPGAEYSYSNLGYNLLGLVIEEISHQSFEDFLKDKILIPYGMASSDFQYPLVPDYLKTTPYTKDWLGNVRRVNHYPYSRIHAASSTLNSSAFDLSNWMKDIMNNEKFIAQVSEPLNNHPQISLGFQQYKTPNFMGIGHFGGDTGFRSFLLLIPSHQIGLILLANCDYDEDFRQKIILPIADELLREVVKD